MLKILNGIFSAVIVKDSIPALIEWKGHGKAKQYIDAIPMHIWPNWY
jgi:hypothetical protein